MRAKSSAEAARAFIDGRRDDCMEWCRCNEWGWDLPPLESVQRTAEVAISLAGWDTRDQAEAWEFLASLTSGGSA